MGLANYYRRLVEGYAELAALLTAALRHVTCGPRTQLALSSAPVLRTFDPARRALLTTDASNIRKGNMWFGWSMYQFG
jgi:hypothetical protein